MIFETSLGMSLTVILVSGIGYVITTTGLELIYITPVSLEFELASEILGFWAGTSLLAASLAGVGASALSAPAWACLTVFLVVLLSAGLVLAGWSRRRWRSDVDKVRAKRDKR